MNRILLLFGLLFWMSISAAQSPAKPNAADLHQAIKKLNVLGSVLYVAAHPDDENQRLISYCANEKLYDVTYLSLTRGDGGQNLIGSEFGELLGVLRTQELLMARSVDGGRQLFSRANDFGFSKNPEETLKIWDEKEVLADVVWAIRQTRPDVIVNRFYHDKKYDTHGHHTASAMLSVEAFDKAGNPDVYPEQLQYTSAWQPNRIFFNTSWFFYGSQEAFAKTDKTNLYSVDIGVYLPLKGKSNNEVAAEARSMHRCQGFGGLTSRGESQEWLDFIKGERPPAKDPFEGINTTWSRVPGGTRVGEVLAAVEAAFQYDDPAASVPELLRARKMISELPDGHWKRVKLADIDEVIKGCLGLYLEATTTAETAAPGDSLKIRLEAIYRTNAAVQLTGVKMQPALLDTALQLTLDRNKPWTTDLWVVLPEKAAFTAPYWLLEPHTPGMYSVDQQQRRGLPASQRYLGALWQFKVEGELLEFYTETAYKKGEPDLGEVWQPFDILPPVFVEFGEAAYLFNEKKRTVEVRLKAGKPATGTVALQTPAGWKAAPVNGQNNFTFKNKGEERTFLFEVTAPESASEGEMQAWVEVEGQKYGMQMSVVAYSHIPRQHVLLPARARVVRADIKLAARRIGYYKGAGDNVPASLRQLGATVIMLEDADITPEKLAGLDAIVLGVRAFNTRDNLKFQQPLLLQYASNGGTLVVQYNNSFNLVAPIFGGGCEGCPVMGGPADGDADTPVKLSRSRVTVEDAEVRMVMPQHAVLNTPNKITEADFKGWVQERGLYFPGSWSPAFEAPLSMNDPDEKPAEGALLVAKYGKGHVVYTALSFFRQLPAGVPGAYRLFANVLSL